MQNNLVKAKSIRNDMVLHQSSQRFLEHRVKQIMKVWVSMMKIGVLHKKNCKRRNCRASNQSIYATKLLQSCKQWSGPATSVTELEQILQSHPDIQERIVRVELACYRDTHKSEVIYNTDLCKINKVTHEERLTNFCVLLQGFSHHGNVTLPANTETLTVFREKLYQILLQKMRL